MGKAKMTKELWLEKNGFNTETEVTYVIWGDDTYSIKDWLKEQGCKFNPVLKWHSPVQFDLPEGFGMIAFQFDELAEWDENCFDVFFYEDAKAKVERKVREAEGPSLSEFVGEVGERLRNLTAVYKSCRGFMGKYGWTNIYTFQSGENILVWFTATDCDLEYGTIVDLTGTVKKHEEFRGVKTTQLSRCIIKEVE